MQKIFVILLTAALVITPASAEQTKVKCQKGDAGLLIALAVASLAASYFALKSAYWREQYEALKAKDCKI